MSIELIVSSSDQGLSKMLRLLLFVSCFVVPALSYSTGAPAAICQDLMPQHEVSGQETSPPYVLTGADTVLSGGSISIALEGDEFKGFVVQARDASSGKPIGEFKIVDSNTSQILNCGGPNTVTHKKIDRKVNRVEFSYHAPQGFKGKVKFVATVAKNGGIFWVQKVIKNIEVQ